MMLYAIIHGLHYTVSLGSLSCLNPRLVRRRLRHIALKGTIVHKNYFYGSVTLLPVTSAFAVCKSMHN
ncbi:hypothetical protein HanHA300_Chr12g0433141 [Helianthus annuus]|nr:hypothetical protein HanHA300_Chr12g0433141 [Helianthus annuus]KAJ0674007.1 hypothetical protein HanLR1_Chr12g0435221 [Helianthus annuus]